MRYPFSMAVLAMKGMFGRKRQSVLLIAVLTAAFSFLAATAAYGAGAKTAARETRFNLYGTWQIARYNLAPDSVDAFAATLKTTKTATTVQRGIVVAKTGAPAGAVGSAEAEFFTLGRLTLISGTLPQQANEIALTTTVLDSLGLSYELGQSVSLPVTENGYDPLTQPNNAGIKTAHFTLCGVLPAYDVFWNTGSNSPVSAIVQPQAVLPVSNPPLVQLFAAPQSAEVNLATTLGINAATAQSDPYIVLNEFAYPKLDTIQLPMLLLCTAVLALTFCAITQLFASLLRRRRTQTDILQALGATRGMLYRLCLWEACICCATALTLGTAIGFMLCFGGLAVQDSTMHFTVPWGVLCLLVVLFCGVVIGGFLLPLRRSGTAVKAVVRSGAKLQKRFAVAPKHRLGEVFLCVCTFVLVLGCLYAATWQLLGYTLNKDNAAINIRADYNSVLPDTLITNLQSLPGVTQVSALAQPGEIYNVTSPEIAASVMLRDVYTNSSDTSGTLTFPKRDTLGMHLVALSPADLAQAAAWSALSEEAYQKLLQGEAALLYAPPYVKNKETGKYTLDFGEMDTNWEPVETGIVSGQTLTVQTEQYAGDDAAGEPVFHSFSAMVPLVGIVQKIPADALLGNNTSLFGNSLFVSQVFLQRVLHEAGSATMPSLGYTNINVRLAPNADYSVRKSIAAIATKRGGILTADSYDIVNQLYKSGLQGAFLFGVAGFLLGALGVLLLGNLFASSLDTQRKRIGVLQAVGASGHKLQGAYVWRSAVQLVFALLFSNLLVFIPIQLLNTPRVLVTFLKTQTMNPTLRFPYPWQAHLLLCALLTLVILLLEWAPLHKVLKQSPAQNMMQAGGV